LVGRRLEHRREGGEQVVDQLADLIAEAGRLSCRQTQRMGLAGFGEMVDIQPVARGGLALGFGAQVTLAE